MIEESRKRNGNDRILKWSFESQRVHEWVERWEREQTYEKIIDKFENDIESNEYFWG